MSREYEAHLRDTRDRLARESGRRLARAKQCDPTRPAERLQMFAGHRYARGAARALDDALVQHRALRTGGWGADAEGRLDGLAQVEQVLDDLNVAQAGEGAPAIVQRVHWLAMLWQESEGRVRRLQRWARKAAQALFDADNDTGGPGAWTQHAEALVPLLQSLATGRVESDRTPRMRWLLQRAFDGYLPCTECSCAQPCAMLAREGVVADHDLPLPPVMECPACGAHWPEQDDAPAGGVVSCGSCGYCSHPERDLDPDGLRCTTCGDLELVPEVDADADAGAT